MSKVTKVKLSDLIADDKNFNKGTPVGNSLVQKSLRKFGAGRSVLIDKNNRLIAGNKTIDQSKEVGMMDVIVIESTGKEIIAVKRTDIDLDSPEGREMALADNASAKANIILDAELVDAELGEAISQAWGIETGAKETQEDAQREETEIQLPKKAITKQGDLFEFETHRLLCGDSTSPGCVHTLMMDEKAQLLFTSPPYVDQRDYGGGKDLTLEKIINFITTFSPFTEFQIINLGLHRKDNEIVPYWNSYIDKAQEAGYKLMSWNVWSRGEPNSIGQQTAFIPIAHEWIFVFGNPTRKVNRTKKTKTFGETTTSINRNRDGSQFKVTHKTKEFKKINTVQSIGVEASGLHPAMFPVALPAEYISALTVAGAIVIEPFSGSGTTIIAADQLKRSCYAMELDPLYCDMSIGRFIKYKQSQSLTVSILKNGKKMSEKDMLAYLHQISRKK